jgi:hypothetical protein
VRTSEVEAPAATFVRFHNATLAEAYLTSEVSPITKVHQRNDLADRKEQQGTTEYDFEISAL